MTIRNETARPINVYKVYDKREFDITFQFQETEDIVAVIEESGKPSKTLVQNVDYTALSFENNQETENRAGFNNAYGTFRFSESFPTQSSAATLVIKRYTKPTQLINFSDNLIEQGLDRGALSVIDLGWAVHDLENNISPPTPPEGKIWELEDNYISNINSEVDDDGGFKVRFGDSTNIANLILKKSKDGTSFEIMLLSQGKTVMFQLASGSDINLTADFGDGKGQRGLLVKSDGLYEKMTGSAGAAKIVNNLQLLRAAQNSPLEIVENADGTRTGAVRFDNTTIGINARNQLTVIGGGPAPEEGPFEQTGGEITNKDKTASFKHIHYGSANSISILENKADEETTMISVHDGDGNGVDIVAGFYALSMRLYNSTTNSETKLSFGYENPGLIYINGKQIATVDDIPPVAESEWEINDGALTNKDTTKKLFVKCGSTEFEVGLDGKVTVGGRDVVTADQLPTVPPPDGVTIIINSEGELEAVSGGVGPGGVIFTQDEKDKLEGIEHGAQVNEKLVGKGAIGISRIPESIELIQKLMPPNAGIITEFAKVSDGKTYVGATLSGNIVKLKEGDSVKVKVVAQDGILNDIAITHTGRLLACGSVGVGTALKIFKSDDDAETWTEAESSEPSVPSETYNAIDAAGVLVLAGSSAGKTIVSTNMGDTWLTATIIGGATSSIINDIRIGSSFHCACGLFTDSSATQARLAIMRPDIDGYSWRVISDPTGDIAFQQNEEAESLTIIRDIDGNEIINVYTSLGNIYVYRPLAQQWLKVLEKNSQGDRIIGATLDTVYNTLFARNANSGLIYASSDGYEWEEIPAPEEQGFSIMVDGTKCLMGGTGQELYVCSVHARTSIYDKLATGTTRETAGTTFIDPAPNNRVEYGASGGLFVAPETAQTLPIASKTEAGIVKIGDNLDVSDGTASIPIASTDKPGVIKVGSFFSMVNDTLNAGQAFLESFDKVVTDVNSLLTSVSTITGQISEITSNIASIMQSLANFAEQLNSALETIGKLAENVASIMQTVDKLDDAANKIGIVGGAVGGFSALLAVIFGGGSGKNGKPGKNGKDGKDGKQGRDGTTTIEYIREDGLLIYDPKLKQSGSVKLFGVMHLAACIMADTYEEDGYILLAMGYDMTADPSKYELVVRYLFRKATMAEMTDPANWQILWHATISKDVAEAQTFPWICRSDSARAAFWVTEANASASSTIHYAYQIRETELVAKDITTAGNQPKIFDIEPFGPDIMVASSKAINEDKYEMFSLSPANGIELGTYGMSLLDLKIGALATSYTPVEVSCGGLDQDSGKSVGVIYWKEYVTSNVTNYTLLKLGYARSVEMIKTAPTRKPVTAGYWRNNRREYAEETDWIVAFYEGGEIDVSKDLGETWVPQISSLNVGPSFAEDCNGVARCWFKDSRIVNSYSTTSIDINLSPEHGYTPPTPPGPVTTMNARISILQDQWEGDGEGNATCHVELPYDWTDTNLPYILIRHELRKDADPQTVVVPYKGSVAYGYDSSKKRAYLDVKISSVDVPAILTLLVSVPNADDENHLTLKATASEWDEEADGKKLWSSSVLPVTWARFQSTYVCQLVPCSGSYTEMQIPFNGKALIDGDTNKLHLSLDTTRIQDIMMIYLENRENTHQAMEVIEHVDASQWTGSETAGWTYKLGLPAIFNNHSVFSLNQLVWRGGGDLRETSIPYGASVNFQIDDSVFKAIIKLPAGPAPTLSMEVLVRVDDEV